MNSPAQAGAAHKIRRAPAGARAGGHQVFALAAGAAHCVLRPWRALCARRGRTTASAVAVERRPSEFVGRLPGGVLSALRSCAY